MRILMAGLDDSPFFPGEKSGTTLNRLARYLRALSEHDPGSTLTDLVYTRRPAQPIHTAEGLHLIPVRAPRVQFFPFAGLQAARRLPEELRPDVITVQAPFETGLLGLWLRRLFKAPLEVQVHSNLFSPGYIAERPITNRLRMLLARYVMTRADAIRVINSLNKAELVQRWGIPAERIALIPEVVEVEKGRPAPGEVGRAAGGRVLFVGRFYLPKNLPGLFQVIETVLAKRPEAEFVVIGDGEERAYVDEQVRRLANPRLRLTGNLPGPEVLAWYPLADVFVLPSLHEGLGRVIIEAYRAGVPAVSTRCGGPEDIIQDGITGFLMAVDDMQGFAEKVLWLLDHPAEAREMGAKGQAYVRENFDPQAVVRAMIGQWIRLYESRQAA